MKRFLFSFAVAFLTFISVAQTQQEMAEVFREAQTPYKYGLVVVPKDEHHMTDCPTVFRMNDRWYMTYVIFDGKGYETWLSESDDLLHWKEVGCLLSFQQDTWDKQQRAGFPALLNWNWNENPQTLGTEGGCYWMGYFGGENKGYEAQPLSISMAYTDARKFEQKLKEGNPHLAWETLGKPVLSPQDSTVQWWETGTHYKPLVYRDTARTLGHEYLLYYNAYGRHPETGLGAERIGIALSDDLVHWQRYAGNPVFHHETKGTITGDAQIVLFRPQSDKQKPLYVMFYFRAFDPTRTYKAYNTFSCSYDLVHWEDWQGEDLIYPTAAYDELFSHKTFILKWQGVVYHFFCAVDNDMRRGIAVATSRDFGQSPLHFYHPFRLGNGFTDHAVLQSNRESVVWGEAMPGRNITVRLNGEAYQAVADGHGLWQVKLAPHKASCQPYILTACCEGEPDTLKLQDLVFGDVWMVTGLSADSANLHRLSVNAKKFQVRTLTPPKQGDWQAWTLPASSSSKEAVKLAKKKPVGIISATTPGAKLKSWTSDNGKWSKILLKPMAPYTVKGILWYDAPLPASADELEQVQSYLKQALQSSEADFQK
ncbi:MAG: hypothetical protein IJP70_11600 [Bacteroidales bacterium]|nr:hypothetical protein [Bacteroidales bacterium]